MPYIGNKYYKPYIHKTSIIDKDLRSELARLTLIHRAAMKKYGKSGSDGYIDGLRRGLEAAQELRNIQRAELRGKRRERRTRKWLEAHT